MAMLDGLALAVLGVSLLVGAWRGLVYEVLSLLGWVAAFWLAGSWSQTAGQWLPLEGWQPGWQQAAGFLVVFVVVIFACGLLAWLAGRMMSVAGLRPADRSLGALFGVVRALVLLVALAWGVSLTPWQQAPWWRESVVAPWLEVAVRQMPAQWTALLPAVRAPELPAVGPLLEGAAPAWPQAPAAGLPGGRVAPAQGEARGI